MTNHQTASISDEVNERLFCFHWEKVWTTFHLQMWDVAVVKMMLYFGSVMLPAESAFTRRDDSDYFHDDFPHYSLGGGGVTSTHNKPGMCHFDQKSSTQKSGNLPKIETQKSRNPKRQAFHLHEKTYCPNQKVLDINSTFQFYLFYQRILLFNFCFTMFVQRVLNFPQPLSV